MSGAESFIQTDAEVEEIQKGPEHRNVKPVTRSSSEPRTSDSEYMDYLSFMPPNLKEDNIDILIINAAEDNPAAKTFKTILQDNVEFQVCGQHFSPRLCLLEEVDSNLPFGLDEVFKRSLFIFLYITEKFCQEKIVLFQGHTVLIEAIRNDNWCVIPVTTEKKRNYELPMMLKSLRTIHFTDPEGCQQTVQHVIKLLENHSAEFVKRKQELHEKRKKYFEDNRDKIKKRSAYMAGSSISLENEESNIKTPSIIPKISGPSLTGENATIKPVAEKQNTNDIHLSDLENAIKYVNRTSHPLSTGILKNNQNEQMLQALKMYDSVQTTSHNTSQSNNSDVCVDSPGDNQSISGDCMSLDSGIASSQTSGLFSMINAEQGPEHSAKNNQSNTSKEEAIFGRSNPPVQQEIHHHYYHINIKKAVNVGVNSVMKFHSGIAKSGENSDSDEDETEPKK